MVNKLWQVIKTEDSVIIRCQNRQRSQNNLEKEIYCGHRCVLKCQEFGNNRRLVSINPENLINFHKMSYPFDHSFAKKYLVL